MSRNSELQQGQVDAREGLTPAEILSAAPDRSGAVHIAVGAASVCWDNEQQFDTERALLVAEALLEWLALEYDEEDVQSPGDADAVAGLEVFQRAPHQPLDNRTVTISENGTVTMTVDQWREIGGLELVQFSLNRDVSPMLAGISGYERTNEVDTGGIPVRQSGGRVTVAATHLLRAACGGAGVPAGTRRVRAKVVNGPEGDVLTFSPADEEAEIIETVRRPRKPKVKAQPQIDERKARKVFDTIDDAGLGPGPA